MSQENVELVRSIFEAWNAGDMRALRETCDPAIVVRYAEGWPEGSEPAMGRDAYLRWCEQLRETWDAQDIEPLSFSDGGDRVVVRLIWHGVGHGPDLNLEVSSVNTLRNGRVILLEYFWDHAEALETVGLSEQAMSQENVGIVRAMLEATGPGTNREDWLDEYFDPGIEWHDTPTYPSAGVYIGREALARHAAEYEEAWADWGVEIEEIRAAGDHVVARIRYLGVGKQSGAPITGGLETPATGAVFELRGGRILRVVQFDSYEEALEAVGLSEQAMSQNVELLRLAVDATNRRDLATLDAIWSEEGEFHSTFAASEGRVFRGRQGLRDYFDTLGEVFDDMHVEIEEISEAGEDRLLVVSRVTGRGKGSGVKVEQRNGQVWTFVDGKIARIDSYMNRAEALEAAGLTE